jgi:hypothetical protein
LQYGSHAVHGGLEQRYLAGARDGRKVFLSLFLGAEVAHLDHDKGVLSWWAGGEDDIGIELARGSFDTVAEMLKQRWSGCGVKCTARAIA